VVPKKLHRRVLDLAHEGHQGIVKTKERLRSKVWWPGIDKDAGRKCKECFGCQLVSKHVPPPPVDFGLIVHFMDLLFTVSALDLNLCILYVSMEVR